MKAFKKGEIDLLAVDDQQDILELSQIFLEQHSENINVDTTTNPEEAITQIFEQPYDAVLSDYDMPQMTGVELLQQVRQKDQDLPFILYTGKGTEEIAQEAIEAGVTDYQQKEPGSDVYKVITNKIETAVQNYREKEQNQIFNEIVEHSENPILVTDNQSRIVYANQTFEKITGHQKEKIIGENPNILSSGIHNNELFEEMYQKLNNGETYQINNMTNIDKNGNQYTHDQQIIPITIHGNTPEYFAAISTIKQEPKP